MSDVEEAMEQLRSAAMTQEDLDSLGRWLESGDYLTTSPEDEAERYRAWCREDVL